MKSFAIITTLLLSVSITSSFTIRSSKFALSRREAETAVEIVNTPLTERFDETLLNYLEKRRGGGGPGGSRGGGSSGSSSSGSSGSSSGSRGSGNTGTASSSSSARPSYGGGRYYGGGATTAYRSGGRSPLGIAPYAIAGVGLGIFPGLWLAGAYGYNFHNPYRFHNASNSTANNESLPVTCLCQKYSACGCDDNGNTTYIDDLLGNGSIADQNSTLVHVGNVNGTKTVVINGTLPNGTDDSVSSGTTQQTVLELSGFWAVGAVVIATVFI
ncbi:hypothetical protein G7Y79_00043g079900 [Physcia stellaris]|nr:hypothetical protein G7Y79_00043g079900 [Physcia stellaris]